MAKKRKSEKKKQKQEYQFPDITAMAMNNEMTGAIPAIVPDEAKMDNYLNTAGLLSGDNDIVR